MRRLLALLPLALVAVAGCDTLPGEASVEGDLYERLDRQSQFTTFAEALDIADLDGLLHAGTPVTVLAPTTTAFEYLGADFLNALRESANRSAFTRVLRGHVIAGRLGPEDFVDGATLQTIDGATLTVRRAGPLVRIDGVTLDLTAPVEAEGSVAYPLANVLLRPLTIRERVTLSPSLSQFAFYARQDGILDQADALPSATLLAPINDAFAALGGLGSRLFQVESNANVRQRVLAAHLVAGTQPLVDGSTLTAISGDPLAVRVEGEVRTVAGARILREETLADGRLLILGGVALDEISLAQRLRIEPSLLLYWHEVKNRLPALSTRLQTDTDELTVFAPTDFAYQLRGEALNNALTDAPNAALNLRLLQTHIVPGRYGPDDLTDGLQMTSLDGTVLTVGRSGSTLTLNGRPLESNGRTSSNGVLYTMSVFVSPKVDALDSALLRGYTQHVTAVRQAGLEDVFRTPGVTTFLGTNEMYLEDPGRLVANPRPFLLWNTTYDSIPTLRPTTFTALDGTVRQIISVSCPDGSDPDVPPDGACSSFQLNDGTQVYQAAGASDGTGFFHILRTRSYPPGY